MLDRLILRLARPFVCDVLSQFGLDRDDIRELQLILRGFTRRRRGVITQSRPRIPMFNPSAVFLRRVGQATRC